MAAMNPYDVLGLTKDATADEVKAAFRREASKAHPDRDGGSETRMSAVNEANAILSDPERRARYDETGNGREVKPVEVQAMELLAQIFAAAVQQDMVTTLEFARDNARNIVDGLLEQRAVTPDTIRKLKAKRARVRRRSEGTNLAHAAIDQQLTACEQVLVDVERKLPVAAHVLQLLEDYEEDAPSAGISVIRLARETWRPTT